MAVMITGLFLMASSVAMSQENLYGVDKDTITDPTKTRIERVAVDMSRATLLAAFSNLDATAEYHLGFFNSNGEMLASYWIDGPETAFFLGSMPPGQYFVVLTEGKKVIDRKQIIVK